MLGHHDQRRVGAAAAQQLEVHPEPLGDRRERRAQALGATVGRHDEVDAHEEAVGQPVAELLALDDVAALLDEEARHGVHDAGPVGAGEDEDDVGGGRGTGRRVTCGSWLAELLRSTERSLRYATAAALVSPMRRWSMSDQAARRAERRHGCRSPVRGPGAGHPRGARPHRRGRGHRDRRRARRPQEHGLPADGDARGAPPRRADDRARPLPPRVGILRLAGATTARLDLVQEARPICRQLASDTGETVNIAVLSESSALYLDQVAGSSALQPHNWVGQHIPLHATSNGKVLLSGLDDARARCRARQAGDVHTPDHHQARAKLREELDRVRDAGLRRRRRRARGRAHRRGGADPQRPRRRGRVDERLRAVVPAPRGPRREVVRSSPRPPSRSRTASAGVTDRSRWSDHP